MKKMYIVKYWRKSSGIHYWREDLTEAKVKSFILDLIETGGNTDTTVFEVVKKQCKVTVEFS